MTRGKANSSAGKHADDGDPLAEFRTWSSERLEQWLEERVTEYHDGLFDAVLSLWCERFPVLDEATWKRLSAPLDISRRAVDPAEIERERQALMSSQLEYRYEEPELTWQDELRIAAFAGDFGDEAASGYPDYDGRHQWDEDNPDPYEEDDPGDASEWQLDAGDDQYEEEGPGNYFAWLSSQPALEEDADPEWDDWLAPVAGRPEASAAYPAREAPTRVEPARPRQPTAEPEPEIRFTNPNLQKGYEFEQWVLSRFKRGYFGLLEWRSDKSVGGWRPQSSGYPDLVMSYPVPRAGRKRFAVECKWRKSAPVIHLPLEPRMERYRRFASEFSMPVVLVLGVGGRPSAPSTVYIIPIGQAPHGDQPVQALARFRRPRAQVPFFWDPRSHTLV